MGVVVVAEDSSASGLQWQRKLHGGSGVSPLGANDPVTGLYYERARWYSPSLGTWVSQDPAQYPSAAAQPRPPTSAGFRAVEETYFAGISLPQLNINGADTYQFVIGNPLGRVDAGGLWYWNNPISGALGHLLYSGVTGAEAAAAAAAHAAEAVGHAIYNADQNLVWGATKSAADSLFHKYCHCKQISEGKFYGVNLSGLVAGAITVPEGVAAQCEGGIQVLVECGAHGVAFYRYGGAGGGGEQLVSPRWY